MHNSVRETIFFLKIYVISAGWLDIRGSSEESKRRQAYTELYLTKETSRIGHVLRHDGLLYEIIDGRMKGKPTRGRRIQMLHDLAMMVALLHSNGQLKTERYGDKRKDVKSLLYSRKLLMIQILLQLFQPWASCGRGTSAYCLICGTGMDEPLNSDGMCVRVIDSAYWDSCLKAIY